MWTGPQNQPCLSQSITSQYTCIFLAICHSEQYSPAPHHPLTPTPQCPIILIIDDQLHFLCPPSSSNPNCYLLSFPPSLVNSQIHPFKISFKVFPLSWRELLDTYFYIVCWGCSMHCLLPLPSQKFSLRSLMSSAFLPYFLLWHNMSFITCRFSSPGILISLGLPSSSTRAH